MDYRVMENNGVMENTLWTMVYILNHGLMY